MALSTRHWVLVTAAAGALIGVAALPPSADYWDVERRGVAPGDAAPPRTEQVEGALSRSVRQVRALRARDTLRARLRGARVAPDSGPVLWIGAALHPSEAAALRAGLDTVRAQLRPWRAPAVIALAPPDTGGRGITGWSTAAVYYLPAALDGRTCVTMTHNPLYPATDLRAWRRNAPASYIRHALGPCAFYAAFGPPGARIEAWLLRSSGLAATVPDWHADRPRRRDPGYAADANGVDRGARLFEYLLFRTYGSSLEATACAADNAAMCRRMLDTIATFQMRRRALALQGVGIFAHVGWSASWWDNDVAHFFADLVRTEGRERFTRFWESSAEPDSAFRAAYGESLESWAARWVRAGGDVRVGPAVRMSSVLISLLLAAVLVGAGSYYTTRRQVS